jgi:hypothetical protein
LSIRSRRKYQAMEYELLFSVIANVVPNIDRGAEAKKLVLR